MLVFLFCYGCVEVRRVEGYAIVGVLSLLCLGNFEEFRPLFCAELDGESVA